MQKKISFYDLIMLIFSPQQFSIIFIIQVRSFHKFVISTMRRNEALCWSKALHNFPEQQVLLRQTISWLMGNWLSSSALVGMSGKRMKKSIFMARERVLFATPFDPSKACFVIESFHERSCSRRYSTFSSFPSKKLLLNQTWIINTAWPPLGTIFKDQS